MSSNRIRIGIGGWTYAPWRGSFYPHKLPQAKEYAASKLGAIEINATFYGRQKPKSWENWEKIAPAGFQFAVKGSRYCVSRSKLAESAESVANFFGQGFEVLGPKLGPILWQFAPFKRFDGDDMAAFIDLLPAELNGMKVRHAIEPRHKSFDDEKFFELCRARNIAIVFEDSDDYPLIEAQTADFSSARLQRMSEDVPTGYRSTSLPRKRANGRPAATPTFS